MPGLKWPKRSVHTVPERAFAFAFVKRLISSMLPSIDGTVEHDDLINGYGLSHDQRDRPCNIRVLTVD
jgi:hypothetical protein